MNSAQQKQETLTSFPPLSLTGITIHFQFDTNMMITHAVVGQEQKETEKHFYVAQQLSLSQGLFKTPYRDKSVNLNL